MPITAAPPRQPPDRDIPTRPDTPAGLFDEISDSSPDFSDAMSKNLKAVAQRMRRTDRRGPLRPDRLISSRARVRGEGLSRAYRLIDAGLVFVLAWVFCDIANPAGPWRSPVNAVMPFWGAGALLLIVLNDFGAYRFSARESLALHLPRLAAGFAVVGALLQIGAMAGAYPASAAGPARLWFAATLAVFTLAHLTWWSTTRAMRRSGRLTPNIVIVGATANAERLIARAMQSREIAVLGIFDDRLGRAPSQIQGVPVLGDTDALIGHRIMPYVDRVVITVSSIAQTRVNALAAKLRALPNDVTLMVDLGTEENQAGVMSRLLDTPLAQMSGARSDERRAFVKRLQDLAFGSVALILALPVMSAVALAVRLDSPGPILFRQRRHGFNNEDIVVWKFRSMHHASRDETASRQVQPGDARVTRVGRFIRNTSLDELPQLFNVLRGEMSLVGPRPHAPGTKTGDVESARLVAEYAHRHRMKPGITGWAAIKGSRGPMQTPEQVRRRVALDIDYIERQSFWLDLYIMAMTLPRLLGDRVGAR
jgi:Undecaprenyl-phosphate glucose phosphotransferase